MARLISMVMFQVLNLASVLTNKKSLINLVKDAENGNDDSLFKALQIDKAVFDLGWVRKRVRKAQYEGDASFFERLGDAMKKAPFQHDVEYGELRLVLAAFWGMGLCRLTNTELMGVLEAGGMRLQDDLETFGQFIRRLKKDGVLMS